MKNLKVGLVITVQPKHTKEIIKAEIKDFKILKNGKQLIIIKSEKGNKYPITKNEIVEEPTEKYELITNEVIKELEKVVYENDIDQFYIDNESWIIIQSADKIINIIIDNEIIFLRTEKPKDIDEDGEQIYRNKVERKTIKGIINYIEKHYY